MMYAYRASNKENKIIKGFIEAQNASEAAGFLRKKELLPITIVKHEDRNILSYLPFKHRSGSKDIVLFTRQLSSMLTSGLTLVQALHVLRDQMQTTVMRQLIQDIISEIEEGKSFSNALAAHPKVFSRVYISLIHAGETSGFLDKVLIRLADNLERQEKLKSSLKSALMYPIIIVIMMVLVMIIMMIFVIPQLSSLYDSLNVSLPLSTQIVVGVSKFMGIYWWFMILMTIAIGIVFNKWRKTDSGGLILDKVVLDLPIFGPVIRKTILAEFTRTLGLLISSGSLVVQSLNEASDVADNQIYKSAAIEISHRVEKGISIGDAMGVYTLFPPILVQMVKIGEQTGKLDESLFRSSEYFEREVEVAIKNLTTAIEPAIMVVLGLGVAFLVFSIITPIYTLTNSIR